MPAFLAIDSSTSHLCLSLIVVNEQNDIKQFDFCEEVGRDHAKRMLPEIDLLVSKAGIVKRDIAAIAVGVGPGSYTGVRVAIATGKGLAKALEISLYGFSTLEAVAITVKSSNVSEVIATLDARRDHVYAASYSLEDDKAVLTSGIDKISNETLEERITAQSLFHVADAVPDAGYLAKQAKNAFESNLDGKDVNAIYL